MSLREGYKQTEIGVLPETWEVNLLGDLCHFLRGSALSKGDLVDNGKNKCIHYGELFTTYQEKIFRIRSSTNLLDGQMSKIGDILMPSSDVTPQGLATASAIFEDGVIIGGDTNILRPKIDLDSLFLSYFMNFNKKEIMKAVTGTTVRHIYNKDLAKLYIPLPPLQEQQKIAEILSTVDQKIDSIDSKIEETKTLKRGLMQRLLSEGIGHSEFKESEIGRIPVGWEVVKLKTLSTLIKDGTHGTHKEDPNGIPLLSAKDVNNGKITFDNAPRLISIEDFNKIHINYLLKDNDILITVVGTLGRVAIVKNYSNNYTFQRSVAIIRLNENCNIQFYSQIFNSPNFQQQLILKSNASAQAGVYLGELEKLNIPFPSLEEQKQIAEILSTTDDKLETLRAKKEAFETLKKGLMQKLLTGEVRV